jgi:hypothetical protein
MALFAILSAGCTPAVVTATFPQVNPSPAIEPNSPQVGLAPVADSRRDEGAGWLYRGDTLVVAGPELTSYIQHKFRNRMIEDGFAPADAAVPSNATPPPYKTVLVTLQSTYLGSTGAIYQKTDFDQIASTDIAVQVFAPGSHTIVFARGYLGIYRGNGNAIPMLPAATGPLLTAATDAAIDQAFGDRALLEALR